MRILWVSRGGKGGADAGDAVYDRKMCAELSRRHDLTPVTATRRGRATQLAGAISHAAALETFAFGGAAEADRIAAAATGADLLVFSHEHLDRLASQVCARLPGIPSFSVRHNVTSDMMASVLSSRSAAGAGAYRALAARQERASLPRYDGIAALSHRDRRLVAALGGRSDVALALPGAPPSIPLAPDAAVHREAVLLGTYDWFAKAWDLRRFRQEVAASPPSDVTLRADLPGFTPVSGLDFGLIRFGLITDRFTAGHKLKTSEYLMKNCIVLSFADVIEDFAFSPHAARFIRRIAHAGDIGPAVAAFAAEPAGPLREAFAAFKADVARELDWTRQATALETALVAAMSARGRAAPRTA